MTTEIPEGYEPDLFAAIEATLNHHRSAYFLYMLLKLWETDAVEWKGDRWLMLTRQEIADALPVSVHQVRRRLDRLKELELLVVEQHVRPSDGLVVAFIRPGERTIEETYRPAQVIEIPDEMLKTGATR